MANWYGISRTNYFKVKDVEKFKLFLAGCESYIELWEGEGEHAGRFGLGAEEGSWPDMNDNDEEIDFLGMVAREHLADDDALIVVTAGAEKLRYVTGVARALNSKGDVIGIDISDINHLIRSTWGIDATLPEY